jgi:hypothetical protein
MVAVVGLPEDEGAFTLTLRRRPPGFDIRGLLSEKETPMKRLVLTVASVLAAAFVLAGSALAAGPTYSLFGDAVLVHPGHNSNTAAQASYDGTSSYGGVDFGAPSGLTVSQLSTFSTDYQFTVGSCGSSGGSPRLVATATNGTTTGNISFYIGPPPNYTGCPQNVWANTGNLASPTNLVDASQLGGGFYEPYSAVQASYGSYTITDLYVVLDGYSGTPVTAQFDNVMINNSTITFETPTSKDQCKNGGWSNYTDANGTPFKNQGDCVSYVATGGRH